jgi:hypothetical protein
MDQSIYLTNQEQVLDCATAFSNLSILSKNADPKPFYETCHVCFAKHAVQSLAEEIHLQRPFSASH